MSTRKISHHSSVKFSVLYYKRNIKHFFRIDTVISTLVKIGKTRNCGRRVSTQFLVFPISTPVDITLYQHGKCFIFLKFKTESGQSFMIFKVMPVYVILV